jgi:hypothetical protein
MAPALCTHCLPGAHPFCRPGQKPPILVYLGVLLQKGKLNALESTELARCVLLPEPSG